tara:strand:+ start:6940 stop:8685 length:1746 start_codon:yes stop_codon:yes gene_type:complete
MPFSSNYQIKLIGTGLESGTWGTSTNNNLERIEQSLGQAVAINVEGPPAGSSFDSGPPYVVTWITSDTSNVGVEGSEGRARYVEFVSDGAFTLPVRVDIRGSTVGILPNRIYFVRNSINAGNAAVTLTLNAGAGATYTVEAGACALVVVNGTSVVGGLTSGTAFNAISNLQVDNLQFSASAADIKLPNNVAAALEIKSTSTNSEFLRFDTANNHLEIAPGSAVNNIELHATDIITSTQPTALTIDPADANALLVKTASKSLVTLNTNNDSLSLSSGTIFLNNATGLNLSVPDNVVDALDVFTGGVNFIRLDTVNGSNTGTLELLPSKCDMTVGTGNTLQMSAGSTLDVDGTATFASATLTTADINGGTIDGVAINASTVDGTAIGSSVVSTVRGSSYSVPSANYGLLTGGFVWEDTGATRAGFIKEGILSPVKMKQTGLGTAGFITSSEMVTSTPTNNTGYFRGEHVFSTDVQSVSVVLDHNLSSTPSRVEWSLVANAASGTENYDVGDMVSLTSSWNTDDANGAMVTTWKNATEIGFNSNRYGARGIYVVDKTNPSAGNPPAAHSRVILSNWKLVVEAWE